MIATCALLVRRSALAGTALAFATWVKLTPVALILWAAWRGERRAATVAVVVLVASLGASILHWGGSIVPGYVRDALLPAAGRNIRDP